MYFVLKSYYNEYIIKVTEWSVGFADVKDRAWYVGNARIDREKDLLTILLHIERMSEKNYVAVFSSFFIVFLFQPWNLNNV